jgi:phosphohistidine phosphatase
MLVHLMQHGACLSKELDPQQPLSPVGKEQIEKSAKGIHALGLQFELIIASPKARSLQAAEIVAEYTGYPLSKIEVTEAVKAMSPADTTINFLADYNGLDSVLIVGHLPSLANVTSQLLVQNSGLKIHIENGGLLQLDMSLPKKKASLNWHLTATQLAAMG